MKIVTGFVLLCSTCAWAADPFDFNRLDAQAQRRGQQQAENVAERLKPQTDVRFAKPQDELTSLPSNESPCFSIHKILLNEYAEYQSERVASRFQWALSRAVEDLHFSLPYCLGNNGLTVLMKRIQHHLIEAGYITTRVVAEEQDLSTGVLKLTVIPGVIRHTLIEDKSSVARFSRLTAWSGLAFREGDLLNIRDIEQSLENLRRLPTADAVINIVPVEDDATAVGESDVAIRYKQAFPFRLNLNVDDSGTKATGKWQGTVAGSLDGVITANDLFYYSLTHSMKRPHWTGEDDKGAHSSKSMNYYYSIPFGYWQFSASHYEYNYHQQVAAAYGSTVDYAGESRISKLTLSRLVFRNSQHKITLSGSVWLRDSRNFFEHQEVDVQRRRTAGWEVGFNHKAYLGNTILELNANYKRGTGAANAMRAPEEVYGKGTSRMQIITANIAITKAFSLFSESFQLNSSLAAQWNRTPLVLQDRFSLGGRYTIRGTDGELTLTGERGYLWRNELAWNMAHRGHWLYVTLDHGAVRGPSTQNFLGRSMTGTSVGLRGTVNHLYYDVFAGKALHVPRGFNQDPVIGFNIGLSF
ncbi:ShlB/FhaC/HecB family hemolysin secretion/activation protein [Pasteurellaceae bacterium LIM206]|nr:ShlB/FhaC/HecB family hemolysin secretion/activation protein [Pasteurellaceae bacterium LIM206]